MAPVVAAGRLLMGMSITVVMPPAAAERVPDSKPAIDRKHGQRQAKDA